MLSRWKKVSPLDFQLYNHFTYQKICLCARMLVLERKERAFIEQVNSRCFVDFRRPYWCTKTVHHYGVSIQSSTQVHETFRQITQKLWATKTWELDKLFKNKSFKTFHFLGFFHWAVSNLFFCCVTVKTIY